MRKLVTSIVALASILSGCIYDTLPHPAERSAAATDAASLQEVKYERVSPSRIRIPSMDLTVELTGTLTQSRLKIGTNITIPVQFLDAFPPNTDIIHKFELSEFSLPLLLEPDGGGGGSGVENGIFMAGGFTSYQVKDPLTLGQKIQITALVTLNEHIPIRDSIPLILELLVEPEPTIP